MINMPEFTLIEKIKGSSGHCDECGHPIKNLFILKKRSNNSIITLGSECVKKVTGKTISQIEKENKQIEKQIVIEEKEERERLYKETQLLKFKEVEADVLKYIEANYENNDFLANMKKHIEENGSIPEKALLAIKLMMKPFFKFNTDEIVEGKFQVAKIYILKDSVSGRYNNSHVMITCLKDGKQFRIKTSFSKTNNEFIDYILELVQPQDIYENSYIWEAKFYPSDLFISLKGKYDGYKISRAKIKIEEK